MFYRHANKLTQPPVSTNADLTVDDMTAGPVDAPHEAGRTVHLHGRVSTYNIYQLLQLLEVGDGVVTDHLTTGRNLMSIALSDELCHHLDVQAAFGGVHVQRTS